MSSIDDILSKAAKDSKNKEKKTIGTKKKSSEQAKAEGMLKQAIDTLNSMPAGMRTVVLMPVALIVLGIWKFVELIISSWPWSGYVICAILIGVVVKLKSKKIKSYFYKK